MLVWIVILVLPIYSARRFQMGSNFLLNYYTFMAINAVIFYLNYLFLIPGLFFQKKRYRYYLAVLALVFSFYFMSDFANSQVFNYISENNNSGQLVGPPAEGQIPRQLQGGVRRRIVNIPHAHFIGYTSSSLFMVFLSLGLRVLEQQNKLEKMQEQMEKAKLNAELAFLKNQRRLKACGHKAIKTDEICP